MATKIDNYVSGQPAASAAEQQLHSQTPHAEGVVKATEKGFGFWKSTRKKLFHSAAADEKKSCMATELSRLSTVKKERESAEPEELVEPFLTRFVGKVQGKK